VTPTGVVPSDDLAGVAAAFALLTGATAAMTERDARGPSRLPGWTRGHVLTHLARNADGQRRMVEGARRDEVLDQYPGGNEQRAADIEAGADRPIELLLADMLESQAALDDAWNRVDGDVWDRLTNARAGTRPLRDGVLARRREVSVHLVDLDVGVEASGLPDGYLERDAAWLAQFRPDW
jgi:maleylpyruvate isomerase